MLDATAYQTRAEDATMEIEDVARLVISPGETLVVKVANDTSEQAAEHIGEGLRRNLPAGVHILLVTNDVTLEVVATADL